MAEKYWYGYADALVAGDWSWDTARFQKTLDNAAAVDKGGGKVGIPCTAHNFLVGDDVTFAGTTNYDDTYEVDSDTTTNEIVIVETYAAETFAGTETATSAITTSNWKLCSDGSNTTKPADDDIVHVDNRAYYDSTNSIYQSIDTNIDATGTGTPSIKLHVHDSFDGDVGASGEYLEIEADGYDIIFEGTGTMYLKLSDDTGNDADCDRFVMNNQSGTAYLASLENDVSNVSLFAEILAFSGTLYIDDDTAVTLLRVIKSDATVYVGTGCTDVKNTVDMTILWVDGTGYFDSPIKEFEGFGGTFNWGTELESAEAGLDSGPIYIYPGHRFNWTTMDPAASILERFINYGGYLDISLALNAAYNKQIGTGSNEISEVWNDGTVKCDSPIENVSFGSGSAIENYGGKIITPDSEQISW